MGVGMKERNHSVVESQPNIHANKHQIILAM